MNWDFVLPIIVAIVAGFPGVYSIWSGRRKVTAEADNQTADAAQKLISASEEVSRQLREQMRQLQVNAAYDRERLDNQAQELSEIKYNMEQTLCELKTAQSYISQLQLERDNQAKRIIALEKDVARLEAENQRLRDLLGRYENKRD